MIRLVTLFNRQGKMRLQKWYESNSDKGQFKKYFFQIIILCICKLMSGRETDDLK